MDGPAPGPGFEAAAPADESREIVIPDPPEPVEGATAAVQADVPFLELLADDLERDPGECWRAFQGLQALDEESRLRIIEGLAELSPGPGIAGLLELTAGQPETPEGEAARRVIERWNEVHPGSIASAWASRVVPRATPAGQELLSRGLESNDRPIVRDSYVTAVDGEGRSVIGLSVIRGGSRVTTLFLCDVTQGVLSAVGEVEEDSSGAGGLLDEFRSHEAGTGLEGAEELALGLLAGELLLNGEAIPESVSQWLDVLLGSGLQPRALPAFEADGDNGQVDSAELLDRAERILDACPSWLDHSALTYDLAEEIVLREERTTADPRRDSGAFRYLFEHRIIHRLEQYGRMLLWMNRYWEHCGELKLAWSAHRLAVELCDNQNAVPAHPFVVALTARSLRAAQEQLGTRLDPRTLRADR